MRNMWWIISLVAVLLIILGVAWFIKTPATPQPSNNTESSFNTYTNTQLAFSLQYPKAYESNAADHSGYLPVTQTSVIAVTLPTTMFTGTNLGEAGVFVGANSRASVLASMLAARACNG